MAGPILGAGSPGPAGAMESIAARLPAGVAADDLAPVLLRLEGSGTKSTGGAAAFLLGELLEARGDLRASAAAFGRAAGRLTGDDKARARYRQGVAWLGVPDGWRARAAFEESERVPAVAAESQLGLALAMVQINEPERARDVLYKLLEGNAGEAEPVALERYASLCDRAHRATEAQAARDRLARRWPHSIEAARLGLPSTLVR